MPEQVWRSFGSWMRTVRPGLAPSEQVTVVALRNSFPELIAASARTFIRKSHPRPRRSRHVPGWRPGQSVIPSPSVREGPLPSGTKKEAVPRLRSWARPP